MSEINFKDTLKQWGTEKDPYGSNPHEKGAKLDAGKPSVWRGLLDYFPRACIAVADVSTRGAKKYAWKGWESVPDGEARYADALARHILKESIEGLYDVGPGGLGPDVLHASQVAWNALARLELLIRRLDANNTISNNGSGGCGLIGDKSKPQVDSSVAGNCNPLRCSG